MLGLSVGIIGCGTAGPAAALFLARSGHRVTIYERFEKPSPIGAGILLQPTGQAVLERLGLRDQVVRLADEVPRLRIVRKHDRRVLLLDYHCLGEGYVGYGVHRGALFEALFEAVRNEPISLELGITGEDLAHDAEGVWMVDTKGRRHGPHDLMVVADGARSRFRDDTPTLRKADRYPWGALWFVGSDDAGCFAGELRQYVEGTRCMLGFLPTGAAPDDPGRKLASLFYSIRVSDVDRWRTEGFESWKSRIVEVAPESQFLVAQITNPNQVLFSEYFDVVMKPWNFGRVVYLGDAGHAMSPQLGQGANLALLDAMRLSEALAVETLPLQEALSLYSESRGASLAYYQFVTRWLTPFFQSDYSYLAPLRDYGMPIANRLGFFNRMMVKAMCGLTLAGRLNRE